MTTLQTEFEFVLPKGYIDSNGVLQREGVMRMATAIDEITPLRDPRVRNNEAYLVVMLLAQVITRLGTLEKVTPAMVEQFYAADIAYLQDLYQQINDVGVRKVTLWCPNCGHEAHIFGHGGARKTAAELDCPFLGEIPLDLTIRELSDAGTPVVAAAPQSRQAASFMALAEKIAVHLKSEGSGASRPAPRIIIEE